MKSLNLGILAHVDAGKTSLTERLLFNAGITKTLGSVDSGTTQTDSMALEQKRGITIKSAVVSFAIGDLKINLIDTPGHPDFIAEVERALSVLDAVILVISAVEGVQPQTRILMKTLKKMKIPTIIFINKIDRMGARSDELVQDIRTKLFPNVIAMSSVTNIGNREATIAVSADASALQSELAQQTRLMELCPIFFGSAMTGVGVKEVANSLEQFLTPQTTPGDDTLSATIFKIERGKRGEKIAYARVFAGTLKARTQVPFCRNDQIYNGKITKMELFHGGTSAETTTAHAGDIVKLHGLGDCQIGDAIGRFPAHHQQASFARPTLEVVIVPKEPIDKPKLHTALTQLSEQDPLIDIHQDETHGTLSLRLYGEVQKEVIQDTLTNEYGIVVAFEHMTTICIERPIDVGEAIEIKAKTSKGYLEWDGHSNPFLATIGLKVEPAPEGSGAQFQFAKDVLGRAPLAFFNAIEETIPQALRQGLYGWQVTDCIVTLTKIEYYPRQSTAHGGFDKNISSTGRDFRYLTPLVFMDALKQASTAVYEPLNRFELDIPNTILSQVLQQLAEVEAKLEETVNEQGTVHLTGTLPVRHTFEFEQSLPDMTGGEGVFATEPGGYRRMRGEFAVRKRTDNNPLHREDYFRRTLKKEF